MGKGVGFLKSVIRGKIQTENIMKRSTFCGEHSEKGTCFFFFFFYFEQTVKGMFRNPLFKHQYYADLEAPPSTRICSHIAGC